MTMYQHRFFQVLWLLLLSSWLGTTAAAPPTILILGDSLSSAYGIPLNTSWVSLLEQKLAAAGFDYRVVNASISGDTSGGGLARLPAALEQHQPDIVLLELGGNDGLRGLSLRALERNLATMIELSGQAGARVVLVEMRIPPNYGPFYTRKFQNIFRTLAERYEIPLAPFLLDGVAGDSTLMQSDGIHPRAPAQPIILDNVWPVLEPLLSRHGAKNR